MSSPGPAIRPAIRAMANPVACAVALGWITASAAGCGDKAEKEQPAVPAVAGPAALTAIPAGANAIGGIDLSAIVASDLWKSHGDLIASRLGPEVDEFRRVCAMDPMATVDSLVAGGNLDDHDGVVVVKGIPRAQVAECSQKLADSRGEKLGIFQEGQITRTEDANGSQMHFGWLDDVTMVIASQGQDRARLEALLAGDDGIASNREMTELLSKVDTSAALWGVMRNTTGRAMGSIDLSTTGPGTSRRAGSVDSPVDAVAVYLAIRLEQGGARMSLDLGLRQESAEKAREVAETLERYRNHLLEAIPGARSGAASDTGASETAGQRRDSTGGDSSGQTLGALLTSGLAIAADGLDVRIQLTLTLDQLRELIQGIRRDPAMLKAIEHFVP